jgi:four helix bundle protein
VTIENDLTRRTRAFVLAVVRFRRGLPRTFESFRFGGQLIDSASGMAANYRAARRSRSTREFVARLGVAEEEADESALWLDLLVTIGDASRDAATALIAESEELTRIFVKAQQTARSRLEPLKRRR